MNPCSGISIIESPFVQPVPRLQLSHDFDACSPESKASFNRWLLERFGTKDVAYVIGGKVFVNPKHAALIKNIGTLK